MNRILQNFIPNQIGKYKDDFMPNAFGDNMQKWGTDTILIESGAYENDREKQKVRKFNFIAILSAFLGISENTIQNFDFEDYFKIPDNKKDNLFDILIRNLKLKKNGIYYKVDIGIKTIEIENRDFTDFELKNTISEIGDLSQNFGYKEVDGNEFVFEIENENKFLIGADADFIFQNLIR